MRLKNMFRRKDIMKKIGVYVLTCGLMLGTVGCGKTPEVTPAVEPTEEVANVEEEPANVEESEPATEEVVEEAEPEEEVISAPDINILCDYDYTWSEDETLTTSEIKREYVTVLSDGYDELKQTLADIRFSEDENVDWFRENVKEYTTGDALDEYTLSTLPWSYYSTIAMERCDTKVLSYQRIFSSYLGGAHPNTYYGKANINVQTGEELNLSDVVTDMDAFSEKIWEALRGHDEIDEFYSEWEDTVQTYYFDSEDTDPFVWVMTNDGITITFDPYVLSYYALGAVTIDIPYAGNEGLFKEEFLPDETRFCKKMTDYGSDGLEMKIDLDNDDIVETVILQIEKQYDEDYRYVENAKPVVIIEKDGDFKTLYLTEALDTGDAYIMQAENGKYYMYVDYLAENDWHSLEIVDLSDPTHGPRDLGYNDSGAFYGFQPLDPEHLIVQTRVFVMGTFSAYRVCTIGDYGQLIPMDEEFRIITYSDEPFSFTTKKNFRAYTYKTRENKGKRVYVTIPAGTKIYPYSSDGQTYMTCTLEDGTYVDIEYDEEGLKEWERTIDGYSEDEAIDGIIYAG